MIKSVFSLFACLIISSVNYVTAQTTLEEYNYLTKGYKIQLESGLDMKKGYKLIDKKVISLREGNNVRKGTIKSLFRDKGNQQVELAAYLIVYQLNNEPPVYYCVPHPRSSPEIIKGYLVSMYDGNNSINQSYRLQFMNYAMIQVIDWNY